jgi:hypothetical protein
VATWIAVRTVTGRPVVDDSQLAMSLQNGSANA